VLAALGYTNVREYVEGKKDWRAAGLPLERSQAAAPRT
jgi:rhodanese-related sulfurtransferase